MGSLFEGIASYSPTGHKANYGWDALPATHDYSAGADERAAQEKPPKPPPPPPDPADEWLEQYQQAVARALSVGTTRASQFKRLGAGGA